MCKKMHPISGSCPYKIFFIQGNRKLPTILKNRFLNELNIKTGSHAKQRKVAKSLHGSDWQVDEAPFMFKDKTKNGKLEVKIAPWSYILDLPNRITDRLDSLKKYV